jgi:hypothetical protein
MHRKAISTCQDLAYHWKHDDWRERAPDRLLSFFPARARVVTVQRPKVLEYVYDPSYSNISCNMVITVIS